VELFRHRHEVPQMPEFHAVSVTARGRGRIRNALV
jgi:hypothetical protein